MVMESLEVQPQTYGEIKWDDLCEDIRRKRCVLFVGPSTPLYSIGEEKIDFYSLAAEHLSNIMLDDKYPFDYTQKQNLNYIAQKFILHKGNYRPRLEDVIADLYKTQLELLNEDANGSMPALYKTILKLPWHTIINMQPDTFLANGLAPSDSFSFYHYKSKDVSISVDSDKFLVYNLFGAVINEAGEYKADSLILTEEDQVDFVKKLVSGNPKIAECVISRFGKEKTYIFLDCNFENWHFRLLLEMLKIDKDFHTLSPRHKSSTFSNSTVEFYKNRYGFVFVNNNSEEFINKLWEEYSLRNPPPPPQRLKKIFVAYADAAEPFARKLAKQFKPWIDKEVLEVFMKDDIVAGKSVINTLLEKFNEADAIILLIDADFLDDASYQTYVKPALDKAFAAQNTRKVFAVLKSACTWEATPIARLNQKFILPANRLPVTSKEDIEPTLKEIATSITDLLWI